MTARKSFVIINIISNFFLQFVTILSGFIVPRIILSLFGSEVNGLIGSLTQFLGYINLVEGGVGGVIVASLYRPLVEKDNKKLSAIIVTAQNFYRKLGLILIGYSVILAVLYPLLSNSSFSFEYASSMTIIIAFQMFLQYVFAIPYQQLLKSDKKVYIVSLVQSLTVILNLLIFIIVSKVFPNIHILKLLAGLVFVVQPILLRLLSKKYYHLDKKAKEDKTLLDSKWDGFAINIAYFIHTGTDITILTIFTNLVTVSVYTVHAIVTNGIRKILQAISTAVSPNIGQLYAKGDKKVLNEKFNMVEFVYFAITSGLLTIAGLLITPFVLLYTGGVTDADYNQPVFAIILIVAEFLYCIREPYFNLAQAAGRFKDMKFHAYVEAGINLFFSIVLVNYIGLVGVAIGTLLGNAYRTLYHVLYLEDHILYRSPKIFFKKFFVFGFASMFSVFVCVFFFPMHEGVRLFLTNALLYVAVTAFFYLIASAVFFRKELRGLKLL